MKRAIGSGLTAHGPPAITSGCSQRPVFGRQGDAAQIEHRQHVAVAEVVLQREAQHVELRKRRERFQAVERQAVLAEQLLHVGQRREGPLAGPIAAVHHGVEHLQAVMAHADRVGVGKGQAERAAHRAMVLAHGVPFAADVLAGRLHLRAEGG